jgi:hypothetical protein
MKAHISSSGTRANGIIPTKIVNDTRTTASAIRCSRRLAGAVEMNICRSPTAPCMFKSVVRSQTTHVFDGSIACKPRLVKITYFRVGKTKSGTTSVFLRSPVRDVWIEVVIVFHQQSYRGKYEARIIRPPSRGPRIFTERIVFIAVTRAP